MIHSTEAPEFADFCVKLRDICDRTQDENAWPSQQFQLCRDYQIFRWFCGSPWGGQAWNSAQVLDAYLAMAAACLTTTFVLTQRTGAVERIEQSNAENLKRQILPRLASGDLFATVGISHLTTSRRHLEKPVLVAESTASGFRINGYSPWVTGASQADWFVVGATLENGEQVLFATESERPGVSVPPPVRLQALTGSHTGPVQFDDVLLPADFVLQGPVHNVMAAGVGARTGGLQTSALAIGHSQRAIDYLMEQSNKRPELTGSAQTLEQQCQELKGKLRLLAAGQPVCTGEEMRRDANSLVLRATQSALVAAKGAGFMASSPVGRWCREALFFLVWSCPQAVLNANLCQFAGIE